MDRFYVLIMAFLSVVLVNNFVFTKFLGTCPYLGVSGRLDSAFGMGLAVTFVTTLSGTLTWLVDYYILMPSGSGGNSLYLLHRYYSRRGAIGGDVCAEILSFAL